MRFHTAITAATLSVAGLLLMGQAPAAQSADAIFPVPDTQPAAPVAQPTADRLDELEFRDASLRDALSLIGQMAGLNLAASDEAAKVKVSIRLRNVTPLGAVQAICQTHGLYFDRKPSEDSVDIITTLKEFQQGLTVFREDKTEVYTLLYPNAEDLAAAINDLYGSRVQLTRGKEALFDETQDIQRRFDKFDLIDERSEGLTSSFLSGSGGGSGGSSGGSGGGGFGSGSSGSSGGGRSSSSSSFTGASNANVQRQDAQRTANDLQNLTPDQLARIASLVHSQGVGLGIDADALTALKGNNSTIYVSVVKRNNQVIIRTSDPTVLDEIARLKAKIDVPTPQVLLEVKVLSVDLSDGFNSVFDVQYGHGSQAAGFTTGDILQGYPAGSNDPLSLGGTGGASAPDSLNPSALIYQYVNNDFRVRMQMLQDRDKVTTLATPLLLVANQEVSRVFIGQERPIIQNIASQTTATQGVVTSAPQTSFTFRPVGTTLLITPNINADRTVTLRLIQETSSIVSNGATIPIIGINGTVTNQPVDVVAAQTLTGTLVAKDGLSLAMGGLIQESVTDTREEIPVLGELPYVGLLFRRQTTGRSRSEVILVIRPFVLSTPAEAEAVGRRVAEANSLHPKTPESFPAAGEAVGGMNTFLPHEVLRPAPPKNELEKILRLHYVVPTDY